MTREEAIKRIQDHMRIHAEKEPRAIYITEALQMAIESLEQEPKTGHWIWCVGSYKCSNCEKYACFNDKELARYCPNCGVKMTESEE